MNEKYTYYLRYACISSALAAALALGGCSSGERGVATQNEAVAANAQDGQAAVSDGTDETIAPFGMDGQILPGLDDVELPEDFASTSFTQDHALARSTACLLLSDYSTYPTIFRYFSQS